MLVRSRQLWWLFVVSALVVAGGLAWYAVQGSGGAFPRRHVADLPGGIASRPLRAARGPGDGPRFHRLGPDACGLDFSNLLRQENSYQYLTNGAGLAAADYDGDGLVDVYLISQDGPNKLFRQTAPLRFEDVTAAAGQLDGGAAWGTGAVFADVDADGDLDLYVCNLEAANLLYENQGDGTFRENAAAYGLDLVAASMMAAFADYDRDGYLDLYLLTNRALHAGWAQTPEVLSGYRPGADTVRAPAEMVPTVAQAAGLGELLRQGRLSESTIPAELREHYLAFRGRPYMAGQPDRLLRFVGGRFVDVTTSAGIADFGMGLSATWCDYDRDGWPDLYVANDLESPDTLYHNEHNGTFRNVTAEVLPHTAYYGMGSDAGDCDGDGNIDLLVADMSMTTHHKAKVLMGDMDNQRPILMHARPPQYMRNALLLNTGAQPLGAVRFQEAGILAGVASTDWTWSVLFGDLDNDARLDIFATNGIPRFDMDPDLKLRVDALWQQQRYVAAIDLIKNVRRVAEANVALRNAGDLQFEPVGAEWGLDLEAVSHGAVLADLDGDGDLDVVVNNWNEPAAIYENRSVTGHAITVALRGQHSERFGVGARVEAVLGDGRRIVRELTLARGYLSGQNPELHFGLGEAGSVATLEVHWPSGHFDAFEDLAAGRHYTVTEPATVVRRAPTIAPRWFTAAPVPPFVHRENNFDEYADQPLLPERQGQLGPSLAFGDADGDGDDDLYVGGASPQAGALWLATADGWQRQPGPWDDDVEHEDLAALWLDHDGDGDLDLFVASGGAALASGNARLQDRLYTNLGDGRFERDRDALPPVLESSGHACACDFDRDGDVDLFVAGRLVPRSYPDAPSSRLYRNDGGRFTDVSRELAPALATAGMVTSALFTDCDGDGAIDLLVAAHWQPIRWLRQQDGVFVDRTAAAGLAPHKGWWNSLCAVDVDRDGDLDYLAGNRGLNTKYKASAAAPARLYFGDFDDNGSRDLIEAKYEGDRLLPVRGRSCSSGAMPFVAQKFDTYDAFARSTLADIYTDSKLASCGELAATTLASCVLQNDGRGHFTVVPLPRRAQLAPIFGMVVVGDLVICGENSFAPEPETGRHDGGTGLVLRIGDGGLEVVPPAVHGIRFFGDRKSVVARPARGGAAEVLFATNSGPLHGYRTAPATDRFGRALPTQPAGTRITFEFADGRRAAHEVHHGSGYLSQQTAIWAPGGATAAVLHAQTGDTRLDLRR